MYSLWRRKGMQKWKHKIMFQKHQIKHINPRIEYIANICWLIDFVKRFQSGEIILVVNKIVLRYLKV